MAELPNCQTLLLEQVEGVLYVSLNRPESRNAMSLAMVEELRAVLAAVRSDRGVRALVLRGADGHSDGEDEDSDAQPEPGQPHRRGWGAA